MSNPYLYLQDTQDAMKWASAFMEIWGQRKDEIDLMLMVGWFANSIEVSASLERRKYAADIAAAAEAGNYV